MCHQLLYHCSWQPHDPPECGMVDKCVTCCCTTGPTVRGSHMTLPSVAWWTNVSPVVSAVVSTVNSSSGTLPCSFILLENVEHCGDEPEQAANMHMNRLSLTLK